MVSCIWVTVTSKALSFMVLAMMFILWSVTCSYLPAPHPTALAFLWTVSLFLYANSKTEINCQKNPLPKNQCWGGKMLLIILKKGRKEWNLHFVSLSKNPKVFRRKFLSSFKYKSSTPSPYLLNKASSQQSSVYPCKYILYQLPKN